MGPACATASKRLADLLSEKLHFPYSAGYYDMSHLRFFTPL